MTQKPSFVIGIDVGKTTSSICVMDVRTASVIREIETETSISAIGDIASSYDEISAIAMESGNLSSHLVNGLRMGGFPAIIIDARHAAPFLREIRRTKSDRNDAYAIAELVRVRAHREVWLKSQRAAELLSMLHVREILVRSRVAVCNSVRGHLSARGESVVGRSAKKLAREIDDALLRSGDSEIFLPLRDVLIVLDEKVAHLGEQLREFARSDSVCQLLTTIPGVGPVTAVWFVAVIDEPGRFKSSREVGAYLGLVPSQRQSGAVSRRGGITSTGSGELRKCLYLCARTLMFTSKLDVELRAWGLRIAERRGKKTAIVAVARKLSIIMHSVWSRSTPYS